MPPGPAEHSCRSAGEIVAAPVLLLGLVRRQEGVTPGNLVLPPRCRCDEARSLHRRAGNKRRVVYSPLPSEGYRRRASAAPPQGRYFPARKFRGAKWQNDDC